MSIGKPINRTHRFYWKKTSLCEPPKDGVHVWYPILKHHFFNKTVHLQKDQLNFKIQSKDWKKVFPSRKVGGIRSNINLFGLDALMWSGTHKWSTVNNKWRLEDAYMVAQVAVEQTLEENLSIFIKTLII